MAAPQLTPRQIPSGVIANRLAIFMSAFAASTALCAILLELGHNAFDLRRAVVLGTLAAISVTIVVATTSRLEDFFVADRRLPGFFNALSSLTTVLGGAGLTALIAAPFFHGFDGLALGLGVLAGVALATVLLSPFMRKFGGYSVASYLRYRFASRSVGVAAAVLCLPALTLIIVAELTFASRLLSGLFAQPQAVTLLTVCAVLGLSAAAAGMNGAAWMGCAAAAILLAAILVPAGAVSLLLTNLPLPPMTYGLVFDELTRLERIEGIGSGLDAAPGLTMALAPDTPAPLAFATHTPWTASGGLGFIALAVIAAGGVAAFPTLLMRASTTPSVAATRASFGWLTVLVGCLVLFAPAIAVFARYELLRDLAGVTAETLPGYFQQLSAFGYAALDGNIGGLGFDRIRLTGEGALLALPLTADLPPALTDAIAAALACFTLAAALGHLHVMAATISEDLLHGFSPEPGRGAVRTRSARFVALAIMAPIGLLTTIAAPNAIWCFFAALMIAGCALLPTLVMSIWWKRITTGGALAGIITGGALACAMVGIGDPLGVFSGVAWRADGGVGTGAAGLDALQGAGSGAFTIGRLPFLWVFAPLAALAGVLAAVIVSLFNEAPGREQREFVRELRLPIGETVFDREQRYAQSRRRRERRGEI